MRVGRLVCWLLCSGQHDCKPVIHRAGESWVVRCRWCGKDFEVSRLVLSASCGGWRGLMLRASD